MDMLVYIVNFSLTYSCT